MNNDLANTLESEQERFGIELNAEQIARLVKYYEIVLEHNPLLHLVGPCTPAEFATRHILESLTMIDFLPHNVRFADVGTGAGLPAIPCLIARTDLTAKLIESKAKKVAYLSTAIDQLDLSGRASILDRQFEETSADGCEFVVCRALDKLITKLPRLLKWSRGKGLLIFGGPELSNALTANGIKFEKRLMPLSEKRFLFIALN